MAVTTSARSWNDCNKVEQMQRRYLKMGVSAVFTLGFFVFLTCVFVSLVILLSVFTKYPLYPLGPALASPTSLCFMMCDTPHWLKCLHERIMSSTWSSTLCGCPFFDLLFFALFLSVCFSHPFCFYLDTDLYLFLHVVDIRATNHWHSAN